MSRHLLERVHDVRRQVNARFEHPGPPRLEEDRAGPLLVLSAGNHHGPRQGGCLLEVASLLAGEPWSDEPECTHPVIAALAQSVNDQVPDQDRHLLLPLVPAVIGTAAADPAGSLAEQWALTVRLVATKEAWDCADEAVHAAACAGPGATDRVALLAGLLAEHARLTGRALPGPQRRRRPSRGTHRNAAGPGYQ